MKLRIFQSSKGDCMLLEAKTKELVLCDGGMDTSMRKYVSPELSKLRKKRQLELVYVSHIDNDHISGVLMLLEDEALWRAYEHLNDKTPGEVNRPDVPRPPVIKGILHNAFSDMITANNKQLSSLTAAKAVEDLLTSMAPSLYATAAPELTAAAAEMESIATGVPEAIKVTKLAAPGALDIPVNKPPGVTKASRLLYAGRPGEVFDIGSMKFTLVGPSSKELSDLRDGWNNWLRDNKERVRKIRAELKRRVDEFSSGALSSSPFDLRDWNGIPDTKGVTAPNVASLVYMVEEGKKRLLLTGDAQQDIILEGLKRAGFLDDGHAHIDVLKVPHHGSENNMDANFARRVSADHYVFCGDGEHENPSRQALDFIFNSRHGKQEDRALSPKAAGRPFHFWFSTTSGAQTEGTKKRDYFREVEKRVAGFADKSGGLLELHFNEGAYVDLKI